MNPEVIEVNAARTLCEHGRGGIAGEVGGAVCTAPPALASVTMINRATPVADVDAGELRRYADHVAARIRP